MGSDEAQTTHRPGPFKQVNKTHKHGRHKSKGAIQILAKGNSKIYF